MLWRLAAFPDPQSSNPRQTIPLAQQAAELLPHDAAIRLALSVAHYRAGSWQAALHSIDNALPLRHGGDPCDWCLLAMIHWRLGNKEKARQCYDRAVAGMEQHHNADWDSFRAEAATLLGLPRLVPLRSIPYTIPASPFTINVLGVVFTPDSRHVLATGDGNDLRLFEAESGKEIRRFTGHTHWVCALALSADGRLALSGGHDRTLRLWQVDTSKEVRQFSGHTTPVRFVAFSPDGKQALGSNHNDPVLRLWDVQTGKVTRRLTGHTGAVLHAVFSPDGREVLSASADKTIRVWNLVSGEEVRQFEAPAAAGFVCVSPDGKKALSVGPEDAAPRLWDMATGKRLPGLEGCGNTKDPPHEAAFTPDGRRAVSIHDRKVRLWDVTTGKELYCVELDGLHPNHVAISRDGRLVATANWRGSVSLWQIVIPQTMAKRAGAE
jgi:WD40 repeat protein